MEAAEHLLAVARNLLAEPEWSAEGEAGTADQDPTKPEDTIGRMAMLFEGMYEAPCPDSFRSALVLPDRVDVRWRRSDAAGEFKIGNPLMARERMLDESVLDWTLDGVLLRETRILDDVVDYAGPLSTLFRMRPGVVEPTLYLFDTRDLLTLELSYDSYLDWAAVSRGLVFWQRLFCETGLSPDKAKSLGDGLRLLAQLAPDSGLVELEQRLKDRS
jgi:hypothetical protein